MLEGHELKFFAKYIPKEAGWRVLCEMPSGDAFIEEQKTLTVALCKAALRAEDHS